MKPSFCQGYCIFFLLIAIGGGIFWYTRAQIQPAVRPLPVVTSPASALEQKQAQTQTISGFVVPHHNIVADRRAKLFTEIASSIAQPKTIILLSPNHYEQGTAAIQTTSQKWSTAEGDIAPDTEFIDILKKQKLVSLEPNSFNNEHGIRLILGDIRKNFPQSTIVPLIFKKSTSREQTTHLADVLEQQCPRCLVIASVDFSHYQPAPLAAMHDEGTIDALNTRDEKYLYDTAEVDSPAALVFLAHWATIHDTPHFTLADHTNSGVLVHDLDGPTTTHVFGYYTTGESPSPKPSVSFAIAPDAMFGRWIAHTYAKKGFESIFADWGERSFWGSDARILNLEGVISDLPINDNIQTDNLTFRFSPTILKALQFLHLNAVSSANNHSANGGTHDLAYTRELLTKNTITTIGGPSTKDTARVGIFPGRGGMRLVVIGAHAVYEKPDITKQIQEYKKDPLTRVIIFPHWGTEYAAHHNGNQEALAHSWIDAGADAVIGAHPHVIQDMESYKGKPILYSLGNFVFDQAFSQQTQEGLFVSGRFTDEGLTIGVFPTQIQQGRPRMMIGKRKQEILDTLFSPTQSALQTKPEGKVLFFPNEAYTERQ